MDLPRRTAYRALSFCRGQARPLRARIHEGDSRATVWFQYFCMLLGERHWRPAEKRLPPRFLDTALRRAYRYSGDGTLQGARVPVTAKLSRKFYEKLGDEVANELVEWFNSVDATYRSDLRELNELNFARFDAKLEQRLAQVRAEMQAGFARFDATLERRVAHLET